MNEKIKNIINQATPFLFSVEVDTLENYITKLVKENELLKEQLKVLKEEIMTIYEDIMALDTITDKELSDDIEEL